MTKALGLRRTAFAGLLATFAAAACQPGTEPKPNVRDPGRLIVSASVAGTAIRTVVVEVKAADINPALVFNLTLDASDRATGTIAVPAGSDRVVTIRAYDAGGIETHRGAKTIQVREGSNNDAISISVLSLGGAQPITVQLSSHSVVVSPAAVTLTVGGTLVPPLTATVTDAAGEPVIPNGELHWATSAPAIATVGTAGEVSGIKVGTATIMATYRGMGGSAAVTVIAAP